MPAPAFVQQVGFNTTASVLSVSATITATAGNLLIAAVGFPNGYGTGDTISVTDDRGQTWYIGGFDFDAGYGHHNYYYLPNCLGGSTVVTATFSHTKSYPVIIVHEVSGLLTSGVFETEAFRHNTVSEAIAPLTDNQYIFTCVWIARAYGVPNGIDSGFTLRAERDAGSGSYCMATADLVQNPAASVDPMFSFTGSPASGWQQYIVSFRPASAGPSLGALTAAGVGTASFVGAQRSTAALTANGVGTMAPVGADAQPAPQRYYMSKGDTFENDLLKLIFNATAIANIADNAASSPLTTLQCALHTADPGEAGSQTTNETAYTGYARVAVNRNSGGFTVTGGSVSPAANIDFGTCTASPGSTITHASFGTASSGAGKLLYSGAISPQIAIAVGVIPRLTTATVITED